MLGCKLSRRTADRLMRAVLDGASPETHVKVSTERSIITLEAENLDDLAVAIAEAAVVGNPEVLDNLMIYARTRPTQNEPARMVMVSIHGYGAVSCSIEGDPAWVGGKRAILEPLIQETRPFRRNIWYGPSWGYASWGLSFALLATQLIAWLATGSIKSKLIVTVAGAAMGLLAGLIFGRAIARARKTEIWIRQNELPGKYWKLTASEIVTAVIAILALVATIVFGVISHKDAGKEDKSSLLVRSEREVA